MVDETRLSSSLSSVILQLSLDLRFIYQVQT